MGPKEAGEAATSEVIDVLRRRASVRAFEDRDVPDDMVLAVLNAARQAPTSSNLQAYSFVVVRDPSRKDKLATLAGNQQHIRDAPVFVAICADVDRLTAVTRHAGGELARGHLEMSMVAVIDAALVGMCASLAGDSLGLGGCMIGGMRNDPKGVSETLDLPDGVFVAFGMTLGWPRVRPPAKPRLPEDTIIHWETYAPPDPADVAARYDATLEAHKQATDRVDGVTWSERLANSFSAPKREQLLAVLKELGFGFD